jgi:hypothetical protein
MHEDEMRKEFEVWALSHNFNVKYLKYPGCYVFPETHSAWKGYRAARRNMMKQNERAVKYAINPVPKTE